MWLIPGPPPPAWCKRLNIWKRQHDVFKQVNDFYRHIAEHHLDPKHQDGGDDHTERVFHRDGAPVPEWNCADKKIFSRDLRWIAYRQVMPSLTAIRGSYDMADISFRRNAAPFVLQTTQRPRIAFNFFNMPEIRMYRY